MHQQITGAIWRSLDLSVMALTKWSTYLNKIDILFKSNTTHETYFGNNVRSKMDNTALNYNNQRIFKSDKV